MNHWYWSGHSSYMDRPVHFWLSYGSFTDRTAHYSAGYSACVDHTIHVFWMTAPTWTVRSMFSGRQLLYEPYGPCNAWNIVNNDNMDCMVDIILGIHMDNIWNSGSRVGVLGGRAPWWAKLEKLIVCSHSDSHLASNLCAKGKSCIAKFRRWSLGSTWV